MTDGDKIDVYIFVILRRVVGAYGTCRWTAAQTVGCSCCHFGPMVKLQVCGKDFVQVAVDWWRRETTTIVVTSSFGHVHTSHFHEVLHLFC